MSGIKDNFNLITLRINVRKKIEICSKVREREPARERETDRQTEREIQKDTGSEFSRHGLRL